MSLSGDFGSIISRMVIDMDETRLQTISRLRAFLEGTLDVRFGVPDTDDARYAHNEAVEKPIKGLRRPVFGGHLTHPQPMIVEYSAFCEVDFCSSRFRFFVRGFFYSVNVQGKGRAAFGASFSNAMLGIAIAMP